MYIVSEEQQKEYLSKISNNMSIYTGFIDSVNKELLSYGQVYYQYTKRMMTREYLDETRSNLTIGIQEAEKRTFLDMIKVLEQLKEDYIKKCYPESATTDQLELDFIGKELEVMSADELKEFYQDNFMDTNKMRLFDIELKKRSRSANNAEEKSEVEMLFFTKEHFNIQDRVIQKISERIKFIDGLKQLSGGGLFLLKLNENNEIESKLVSLQAVISAVNNRSTISMPSNIDIFDLLDWRL